MICSIQDIAGCRLTVSDIADQGRVVQSLGSLFEDTIIVDRRENPSHGYRAVHVIVKLQAKMIEIQVRTSLQHLWAEFSEKLSDIAGSAIKYGGGDESIQTVLARSSDLFARVESLEEKFEKGQARLSSGIDLADNEKQRITEFVEKVRLVRQEMFQYFGATIEQLKNLKGKL